MEYEPSPVPAEARQVSYTFAVVIVVAALAAFAFAMVTMSGMRGQAVETLPAPEIVSEAETVPTPEPVIVEAPIDPAVTAAQLAADAQTAEAETKQTADTQPAPQAPAPEPAEATAQAAEAKAQAEPAALIGLRLPVDNLEVLGHLALVFQPAHRFRFAADLVDEWALSLTPLLVGGDASRAIVGAPPAAHAVHLDRLLEGDGILLGRWLRDR